ncbi:PDZ domain-containing protein [Bacillus lacus]|uniref:endopeptidase La n=2 Tax=Metabacillus lacus TaxID=1983721 RepID=A0A7X2IWG6_9BACI|nr:PDZ domain-containing protein [Metabacillus lacus]
MIAIIIIIIINFIKLPYYVTRPGMATELEPIVEVENGYEEEGSFSLTTVRIGRANPFTYLSAQFNKYHEIFPVAQVKQEGESDAEYLTRQIHLMETSQDAAIAIAYTKAGKKVEYRHQGVYITFVMEGMPGEGKLKAGDRVFKADDKELTTAEEFIAYVGEKSAGDEVAVTYKRDGKENTVSLTLAPFPNDPERAGVGISLVTDSEVVVDPKVTLKTEDIGGPSAGLMMSLEIYNQLVEEDITKGQKIAGTGTINSNGEVGPIGGISQKIVAADKAGASIFFAPNEKGKSRSNYEIAIEAARDIDTKMKVVPVDTFDDALHFLMKKHQ